MSDYSRRRKELEGKIYGRLESADRYVDISARLTIVRVAQPGETPDFIDGARPFIRVGEEHMGGLLDTALDPPGLVESYDGGRTPAADWRCSEDQWKIIEHRSDEPIGKLAVGGMGAGKTTAGVIWVYRRWTESLGTRLEGGITAPTETRLSLVFNEIFRMFPRSWWQFRSSENMLTMCDGFRIRGVSTYQQSEAQGTRIAGFNWQWWLGDELQDQINQFVHIQARLRSKADGRAKRLGTATEKDDPEWRTFKDSTLAPEFWSKQLMLGPSSPFIHPDHWKSMAKMMTDREYRRVVLAEDLPPESRLYNTFDRKHNLRPIPLGARKITSVVLRRKTGDARDALLIGHDPGAAKAGSVWLDAYELPPAIARQHGLAPNEVLWWARAELFTLHATHEQHATQAMALTRQRFGCNQRADSERAHVRVQPLGQAEDKPDLDVMRVWQRIGFHIKFAQYSVNGTGKGQIKKESRIGMLNTLFCDAAGRRRLFIECDDRGQPACPLLLAALESMERDHLGRPEHEEKDVRHDKSDLPAALGYGLWFCEKESALSIRADIKKSLG